MSSRENLSATVEYQLENSIAFIRIDNPPVNALSGSVVDGMNLALDRIDRDPAVKIAVLSCGGRGFIAGADLKEISRGGRNRSDDAAAMVNRIAQSRKPVVAAIHGNALGGGFETALACDYRLCARDARFGLPEVNIGAMPGYGATQRLPRLIGYQKALEMMLTGQSIDAATALDAGAVDEIANDNLVAAAQQYAQALLRDQVPCRKVDNLPPGNADEVAAALEQARVLARRTRPGEDAPALIMEAVANSVSMPIQEGLRRERELSSTRVLAPQGLAMRHLFFAERGARKSPLVTPYLSDRAAALEALVTGDKSFVLGNRLMAPLLAAFGSRIPRLDTEMAAFNWQAKNIDIIKRAAQYKPADDSAASQELTTILTEMARVGRKLLSETPELRASDVDVISCCYGFPRYLGGIMYYADHTP